MADATQELGRILGTAFNEQSAIQENLSPDDAEAQLNTVNSEFVEVRGQLTVKRKEYSETAFILDHPIQGELDSAVYELDGGYKGNYFSFPVTFPLVFSGGEVTLYTKEF